MKKSDAKIYLEAAKMIDADVDWYGGFVIKGCSCLAVEAAAKELDSILRFEYDALFSNGISPAWGYCFGDTYKERKSCRVLALLFMAQIALTEGR